MCKCKKKGGGKDELIKLVSIPRTEEIIPDLLELGLFKYYQKQ